MEEDNKAIEGSLPPPSKLNPAPIFEEEEKKRIAIVHAWQRDLPVEEIAELASISIEKVEAIIRDQKEKD